jgi:hypothetical protein
MVCDDEAAREWLTTNLPNLVACAGSRLKLESLEGLLPYRRVLARFPGSGEDKELYFLWLRRLKRGLETGLWRAYERKEEPSGVCLVFSVDSSSIAVLEGLGWRPHSCLLPSGR